ncbi:hypothetical protein [Allorhizobium undicola]|uniref:hypothetical protein n=1 Tax=Allorhizobium undicola TaxID=78527 RepID=UPI000480B9A1|nr:hypothetical protein [Allorhizobium undicola]
MSDVHIITQIRRAFKQLLSDAAGEEHVHNLSRLATGGFQSNQYPLVILAVTDTLQSDQEHGIDRVEIAVDIKISERTSIANPEESIDAMRLRLQKALADRGDLGFGKYYNWRVGSLSAPDFEPMSDHPDSIAISAVMPVSFTLSVPTADYSRNLNS